MPTLAVGGSATPEICFLFCMLILLLAELARPSGDSRKSFGVFAHFLVSITLQMVEGEMLCWAAQVFLAVPCLDWLKPSPNEASPSAGEMVPVS